MENLLFGILTVLLCSIGYFYSWKQQTKNNYKAAVWLLLLCGFLLRLYTASDFFLHEWDERYHVLVAKHLMGHPFLPTLYDNPILPYDCKNWTSNYVWLSKPPIPLWFMSFSLFIFGNNELAARIPSLLVSTFSIFLTFQIARMLFNKKTAWIAAFLHSVNGMLIELAAGRISSDHVETFFVFFIELAAFVGLLSVIKKEKNWLYILMCAAFTACAFLSKFMPAFLVFPVWLSFAILFKNQSSIQIYVRFIVLVIVVLAVSSSWIIYTLIAFPLEGEEMLKSLIYPMNDVVQNHSEPVWFYFQNIGMVFGEIVLIPLLWLSYKSWTEAKSVRHLPILLWIAIPLIVFSFAATKRYTYLLISAPAIFIMIAYFWRWLSKQKINPKYQWIQRIILILLIALPIRYAIERIKPFSLKDRNPAWVSALREMKNKNIQRGVLFNYNRPIEAMFYTDFTVYSVIPTQEQIDDLLAKGYIVMINNNAGKVPAAIRNRKDVLIENLPESQIH